MIKYLKITILLLAVITQSCIEKYFPDIKDYQTLLVVDGMLTSDPSPYTITLSLSSPADKPPNMIPYQGATVVVIDNFGNKEVFNETEPGTYVSSPDGMQGTAGREYKLSIHTSDGKVYESPFQELKAAIGISTVYAEIESWATEDEYHTLFGYQFYVDTETAATDSTYLMWLAKGTYKYRADFLIRYIYDNRRLSLFPKPDSLRICYHTDYNNGFFTANLTKLSLPTVTHFPLNYVTTDTRKISLRYSMLVEQYTIDEHAFTFYEQLSDINTEQGVLYAQQPYQLKGNMQNINDQDDVLLGYFLVAGIDKKRIFVNRPPSDQVEFHYSICVLDGADYLAYGDIFMSGPSQWPLYVTTDSDNRRALPDQRCMDCRLKGGTTEKPDFWVDE